MIIKSKRICTRNKIVDGYLVVENGKIIDITTEKQNDYIDFSDKLIIPGIFDTHNHSCGGYSPYGDFQFGDQHDDGKIIDPEVEKKQLENRNYNIEKYLKVLASLGVTSVLTTLFATRVKDEEKHVISALKNYVGKNVDGAKALGINFEGPFLDRTGEGAADYEPDPVSLQDLKDILEVADGSITEMGMAPELPNAKQGAKYLLDNGVTVAMAHTNGKSQEAFDAFDNGVSVATHTCNVMVGIHHRNIGSLGAALMDDRCYCELICDGLHVCNDMLKLVLRLKDHNKIMLISDSSEFVGFPSGYYDLGTYKIHLDEQGRVLEGSALSGSSKGVIFGIKNLVNNCGVDLLDALNMACMVPCQKFGFTNKGSLEINKDADFVVIDDDYNVIQTYVEGNKVFDYNTDEMVLNPKVLERKYA